MDLLRAAPTRSLAVCAPRQLQVWQPSDALWPSAPPAEEDEADETADESGSARDGDGDGDDEQLAVKEEQAPHALRSLASAASRSLSDESPSRERRRAAEEQEPKPKKKRTFKKRKPTHTVRKEEKQALLAEIELLQARLDELKFQALVEKGEAAKTVARQRQSNLVLRESIEEHHVAFARVQSLLSGYVQQSLPRIHPTKVPIKLGLDRGERHRTLMAMKEAKIREAWRFMVDRTAHLQPETPFYEEERYNSQEGDYCVVRLDVVPLTGAPSVHAILIALRRAIANAEIIISEISGNITIREDDNHGEASLMQARLVSSTTDGTFVESNSVTFSEYFADGDYAVIAGDYVDEDLLYPYRPQARIRRDGTSIITVTPRYVDRRYERRDPGEFHCGSRTGCDEDGRELVVILKRWAAWKFHHTDLAVADDMVRSMRDSMGRWGETILDSVRESLTCMSEHEHHASHDSNAF